MVGRVACLNFECVSEVGDVPHPCTRNFSNSRKGMGQPLLSQTVPSPLDACGFKLSSNNLSIE